MALSDFIPESRPVVVNGKALFNVAGLSLDSLAVLVRTHLPDLEAVFDIVMVDGGEDRSFQDHLIRVATDLAVKAPALVGNLIAQASGETVTPELIAIARRLPFPVQVDALTSIGVLTFDEAGGVKKAIESLMSLLGNLRAKPLATTPNQGSFETTSAFGET